MNPIKTLLAVSLMMLTPAAATAQENIKAAFDALLQRNESSNGQQHKLEKNPETGEKIAQLDVWEFSLPTTEMSLVTNIEKAFERDRDKAYTISSGRFPHASPEEYEALAVGDGSEVYYVGTIKGSDYTYAAFLDPEDGNHRYAYALEWKKTDDNQVIGKLAITYATTARYRQQHGAGNRSQWQPRVIMGDFFDSNDFPFKNEVGGTAWLAQFNTYAKLFRKSPNSTASPYYANYINKLCKRPEVNQLTTEEKKMVLEEIAKLVHLTDDEFTQKVFLNAMKYIKP